MGNTYGCGFNEKPDTCPVLIFVFKLMFFVRKKNLALCEKKAISKYELSDEPLIKRLSQYHYIETMTGLSVRLDCSSAGVFLPATKPHQYKESLLSRRIIRKNIKPCATTTAKKAQKKTQYESFSSANHLKHESKNVKVIYPSCAENKRAFFFSAFLLRLNAVSRGSCFLVSQKNPQRTNSWNSRATAGPQKVK